MSCVHVSVFVCLLLPSNQSFIVTITCVCACVRMHVCVCVCVCVCVWLAEHACVCLSDAKRGGRGYLNSRDSFVSLVWRSMDFRCVFFQRIHALLVGSDQLLLFL